MDGVNQVIGYSIGVAFVLYLIVSFCGYATYGSLVQSDILKNYPRNGLTSSARIFVALLVAFSYPLQQHPARRSVMSIVNAAMGLPDASEVAAMEKAKKEKMETGVGSKNKEENVEEEDEKETVKLCGYDTRTSGDQFRLLAVTVCFLLLSFAVALAVKSLGKVLAFVGATGSTMVSYILPGFCYYYIFDEDTGAPAWKRHCALAQGIAGCIIIPVCLTFIFV